uniref:Uncharacterized protein n=1 Tax=uncultured marine virus TaxID=186617 RepID=A0A0F7L725_9VIRU|nr:hypothetical protein [uncultured marine virus]
MKQLYIMQYFQNINHSGRAEVGIYAKSWEEAYKILEKWLIKKKNPNYRGVNA